MKYNFSKDLQSIREILGLTQNEFAKQIGVEQVTISRNELGKTDPSAKLLERVYIYAFVKNIKINKGSITNFVGFPIPLVALSAHIE